MGERAPADRNIFMLCESLHPGALGALPAGYHFRKCREDELDLWKAMPFDDPKDAAEYDGFMSGFFERVYGSRREEFFRKCLFACDSRDRPVGTVMVWKVYDAVQSIHWWKVRKDHEGKGVGRALLSEVMKELKPGDYPVILHTQPGSFRAIDLYSRFGFRLLTDPVIGSRRNELDESLPELRRDLGEQRLSQIERTQAPPGLLKKLAAERDPDF